MSAHQHRSARSATASTGSASSRPSVTASTGSASTVTAPRAPSPDLLQRVLSDPVDPDYAVVAATRGERSGGSSRAPWRGSWRGSWRPAAAAAVIVLGLLVAAAAVQQARSAPQLQLDRDQLVDEVLELQASIAAVQERIAVVREDIEALQGSGVAVQDPDLKAADLGSAEVASGVEPVTGPGLRVVVDDAPDAGAKAEGRVLDRDLQFLVNGLWQSGAEAIAVNGNRLGPQSAIRVAGEAITVNYRSLDTPYVVQAIGDPTAMQARFIDTDAGQTWVDLKSNFGLGYRVVEREELSLPAVPSPRLTHAELQGDLP